MRFLIIGLGSIGRRHTRNLAALHPKASFSFLRRQKSPDALVSELGGDVFTDLGEALKDRFDLVVLATPSALHMDALALLIASGLPLLIEKPIVTSPRDCERCLELIAASPPAPRAAGFNFRYVPSLLKMKQLIQDGTLGTIVSASFRAGQWLPDWRPDQDYTQSYSASRRLGGGVELDLVHEIDVARWFFGDLDLRFAMGGQLSALSIESNDVTRMILSPDAGGPIVDIGLDYVSRQRVRRYEITGDKGSLIWDIGGQLDLVTDQGRTSVDLDDGAFDVGQTYVAMLNAILDPTGSNDTPRFQSLEDGIISSQLAIAARDKGQRP